MVIHKSVTIGKITLYKTIKAMGTQMLVKHYANNNNMPSAFAVIIVLFLCTSECISRKQNNKKNIRSIDNGGEDDSTVEPSLPEVCGQYGFRCIDEQSFQVCRYTDIDGQTEEPQAVHQCQEDMICDEDNIAYCSPRFRLADAIPGSGGTIERRPCTGLQDADQAQLRRARNTSSEFECQEYGLFADSTNQSMFWFCERDCQTKTFKQRHMFCKHGRIFDNDCKQCVSSSKHPTTSQYFPNQNKPTGFTCTGRRMGKYADTSDCQKYHICLPRNRATMGTSFNQIVLLCPDGTAYNSHSEQCDASARSECADSDVMDYEYPAETMEREVAIGHYCEQGTRKIDPTQNDCTGYTLCRGKRWISVRCPQHHRFDESQQKCRPAALVDC